eukprot:89588_1
MLPSGYDWQHICFILAQLKQCRIEIHNKKTNEMPNDAKKSKFNNITDTGFSFVMNLGNENTSKKNKQTKRKHPKYATHVIRCRIFEFCPNFFKSIQFFLNSRTLQTLSNQ